MSHVSRRAVVGMAVVIAAALAAVLVPRALSGGTTRADGAGYYRSPGVRTGERIGSAVLLRSTSARPTAGQIDPSRLAVAEQDFGLDLLRHVGSGQNVTVSPASLALALAMLEHGARGRTAQEIKAVLRTSALSADDQGAAWRALTDAWAAAAAAGGLTLESANSLWQQLGLRVRPDFLRALNGYYDTGVWQVDFAHAVDAADAAINEWTMRVTHGRISKLFDKGMLDSGTRLVLANAVYFKAAWAEPFDAADTRPGPFTRADGSTSVADFMTATRIARAAVRRDYTALDLPYRGGRFAALAVMPTHGSLADFAQHLTAGRLSSIADRLRTQPAAVALPKFETSSALDLNTALAHLGLRTAFGPAADLSGIAPGLAVQQVVQRTFLKVGEQGTEAAAVTGIGVGSSAAAPSHTEISFDHPFLFIIRDTTTGTILFATEVMAPRD